MTWYRVGPAGIPGSLKTDMNAVLNKKLGTSGQNYPPKQWPGDVNLMGALEEKTASGAIAHIDNGADEVPIKSWLVTLPASLSAYSSVTAYQNTGEGTTPTQYTASLDRTIYGGQADIVTGEGEDGEVKIKFSDLTWAYTAQYGRFQSNDLSSVIKTPSSNDVPLDGLIAEGYVTTVASSGSAQDRGIAVTTVSGYVLVYDSRYTDVETFLSAEGEKNIVYPLATPETFTFTPIQADTELGTNNFWANEGESEVTYRGAGTITPVPVVPTLITKTITENGTYSAEDDDADGYSEVTVNVEGGEVPFVPTFTETLIADNTAHASSFTLTEDYGNYDMVKIVWYESASVDGFLYTTPDILDEIFTVGVGKLCINKPSTNYYVCYSKSGLTWTQTNQRNIYVHEIYGVTFTNCTMTATDLYKRGASTTTKYAITSQESLKDYDLFIMSSIHATDGSETMPTTWLYQYPPENMSGAFSCPVPTVLQEYNANDEAFVISEYGMTSARYFMVQGIKFT